MLKLAGAMLILVAGTLLGFQKAATYTERLRQIKELIHLLQRLETEIGYGSTPLPEALLRSAGSLTPALADMLVLAANGTRQEGPAGSLSFAESWKNALELRWQHTALKENEKVTLLQLGRTLGVSDREDQMKHLRLALVQLQSEEVSARDEQNRYEKMYKSLGVLVAALLVILMV